MQKPVKHIDLRNRHYCEWIEFLEKAESWSREEIAQYQSSRLKQVVEHAYENTEAYARLYDQAGLKPDEIQDLEDIGKLPFTEKELMRHDPQKFSANIVKSEESIDKLVAYTNAFMANGGSHIQYNMVDTDELKDAKVNPEKHSDLIVRIGGFSAYFTQLSPDIQDDVINRNEHEL